MLRIISLAIALVPAIASATFTTQPTQGAKSITFDEHPNQEVTLGPVTLTADSGSLVSFTATNQFGSAGFSGVGYGLGDNGAWLNGAYSFAWVNGSEDGGYSSGMTFTFMSAPVSFVGGLMNYIPGEGVYHDARAVSIIALDSNGGIIESYGLEEAAPIRTPGQLNAGEFRGISRSAADIYAFRIQGAAVVRSIAFSSSTSPVPEPTTWAMFACGLAGLCLINRVKR
jgi:hypothetical protein